MKTALTILGAALALSGVILTLPAMLALGGGLMGLGYALSEPLGDVPTTVTRYERAVEAYMAADPLDPTATLTFLARMDGTESIPLLTPPEWWVPRAPSRPIILEEGMTVVPLHSEWPLMARIVAEGTPAERQRMRRVVHGMLAQGTLTLAEATGYLSMLTTPSQAV